MPEPIPIRLTVNGERFEKRCEPRKLLVDFLRLNPSPTEQEIREAISAVLCRCTGYRDIVRSIAAAADKMRMSSAVTG